MKPARFAVLLLLPMGSAEARLPSIMDVNSLSQRTFDERFQSFDQGVDQQRPAKPHRWRTVAGFGGPLSPDNRFMSGTSFASDREFAGVAGGKPGTKPLGLDPFRVEPGGSLTLLAKRTPRSALPLVWNKPYYSGRIATKFSFSQLFGYFEVEAKLPAGKGMWPAFWLLPMTGQWPANGELDIFEGLGDPRVIFCSVISGRQRTQQKRVTLPFDASADFHRYGAAWGPDEIVWYVDGREVSRVATPADMKQIPMHIVLNLAVGGSWGGQPDEKTIFPGRFTIRRVSAWKLPTN